MFDYSIKKSSVTGVPDTLIVYMRNLQTSFQSHNDLARLFYTINSYQNIKLILDFSNVTFIAANQFSVLGCILSVFGSNNSLSGIYFVQVPKKIRTLLRVNGFGKQHLSYEPLPDTYNTAIPYRIFSVSQIDEFEKYITIQIFERKDIPAMSTPVRDIIIDNILEMFNNVKEHTHNKAVYTCGQFFPSKSLLHFTITDAGETIPFNVRSYFSDHYMVLPPSLLEWAMQSGNTTRRSDSPGGLGLYLLSEFINLNNGELYIVSGNETFEQTPRGSRYKNLDYSFPGTIVTMAFNLNDSNSYYLTDEKPSDFIF